MRLAATTRWWTAWRRPGRSAIGGGRVAFGTRHLEVPRHELDAVAASLAEQPLSWVRRGCEPDA